jgi:spoIIIJ-associated protein
MATSIEAQGLSVDEAIQIALNQLGVSRDKVEIEILHHPRRGLLGIGARRAKVRATLRESVMLDGEEFDMSGGSDLDDKPRRRRRRGGRNRGRDGEGESSEQGAVAPRPAAAAPAGRADNGDRRGDGRRPDGDGGRGRGDGGRGRDDRRGGRGGRGERSGGGEARVGGQEGTPRQDGRDQRGRSGEQRDRVQDQRDRSGDRGQEGREGAPPRERSPEPRDRPQDQRDRSQEPRERSQDQRERGGRGPQREQGERRDRGRGGQRNRGDATGTEAGEAGLPSSASDREGFVAVSGDRDSRTTQTILPRRPQPSDEPPLDAAALDAIRARGEELVRELLVKMGFAAEVESSIDEAAGEAVVTVRSENEGLLIGRRGQTLDSLEHIVNRMVLRETAGEGRVQLDIGDYRRRRRESLEELAARLRTRAVGERRTVQVSPMSPRDRKFFALAFADDESVEVRALGAGFYRRVIVAPAGMGAEALAEAVAAGGEEDGGEGAFVEAES